MRKIFYLLLPAIAGLPFTGAAQLIANGSFENNTTPCRLNLTNVDFNAVVSGVRAFGAASQLDIMKDTCGFGAALDGRYFLGLAVDVSGQQDALSLALNTPLLAGQAYRLFYNVRKDSGYASVPYTLGYSAAPGTAGTAIGAAVGAPGDTAWMARDVVFIPSAGAGYLTISAAGTTFGWTHFDDFRLAQLIGGGIDGPDKDAAVAVHPNPASHAAAISLGGTFRDEAQIELIDLTGRIIQQDAVRHVSEAVLSLRDVSAGVYLIRVANSSGAASCRLVVSH